MKEVKKGTRIHTRQPTPHGAALGGEDERRTKQSSFCRRAERTTLNFGQSLGRFERLATALTPEIPPLRRRCPDFAQRPPAVQADFTRFRPDWLSRGTKGNWRAKVEGSVAGTDVARRCELGKVVFVATLRSAARRNSRRSCSAATDWEVRRTVGSAFGTAATDWEVRRTKSTPFGTASTDWEVRRTGGSPFGTAATDRARRHTTSTALGTAATDWKSVVQRVRRSVIL